MSKKKPRQYKSKLSVKDQFKIWECYLNGMKTIAIQHYLGFNWRTISRVIESFKAQQLEELQQTVGKQSVELIQQDMSTSAKLLNHLADMSSDTEKNDRKQLDIIDRITRILEGRQRLYATFAPKEQTDPVTINLQLQDSKDKLIARLAPLAQSDIATTDPTDGYAALDVIKPEVK